MSKKKPVKPNKNRTIINSTKQKRGSLIEAPVGTASDMKTNDQLELELGEYSPKEEQATNEKESSLLAEVEKIVVEAVVPAKETQKPPAWELVDKNGKIKAVPLLMPPVLYAKMLWLTQNIGKMSLQKLGVAGTTRYVDELIVKHYRAE